MFLRFNIYKIPWNSKKKNRLSLSTVSVTWLFQIFFIASMYRFNQNKLPRSYWPNFWQLIIHIQQNMFYRTLIKVCSLHLYISLGTFLVNSSRHSESLKYAWKSTNRCYLRKMSSISEFFRMFNDSLCLEWLTNLDAKGAKRSVKIWTKNYYKSF